MWRSYRLSLVIAVLALLLPSTALTHDIAASGPVKSTIHIDPEDSPVVGQPATILIRFERGGQPFDLAECACTVTVVKSKTTIETVELQPPTAPSVWSAMMPFTFPGRGAYTLVLTGNPKHDPDTFPPFTLRTVFRVIRTDQRQPATTHDPDAWTHNIHFIVPGAAAVFLVFGLIDQARRRWLRQAAA